MFENCRVCLSRNASKDICELNTVQNDTNNYLDILSFCLNIEVKPDIKMGRKLCLKCFKKILAFYEFKVLALKNNAHLKSILENATVKLEPLTIYSPKVEKRDKDNVIEKVIIDEIQTIKEIKEEPEIYEADFIQDDGSDNELLSTIQKIKYEYVTEGVETLEPEVDIRKERRKKRGCPKGTKKNKKKAGVCEQCGKAVKDLTQHVIMHLPPELRRKYPCKDCDKVFATPNGWYRHNRIKHKGYKQHCNICNKDVTYLAQHNRIVHNPSRKYVCPSCDHCFPSPSSLEIHMLIHTKQRPHECDICKKTFRLKVMMLAHKRQVHDKEKSHLCQFCSKSFFKKGHLQIHIRSHTKEKPYKCKECGRGFASPTQLKKHVLLHAGERKYHCEYCSAAFILPCYLTKHTLIHTKEKKYPCRYCEVKFGRSDHRNRHEYTAHQKNFVNTSIAQ